MDIKKILIIGISVVMFLFIVRTCNQAVPLTPERLAEIREKELAKLPAKLTPQEEYDKVLTNLEYVETILKAYSPKNHSGSLGDMNEACAKLMEYSSIINNSIRHDSIKVSKKAKSLQPVLKSVKKKAFPHYRKIYTQIVRENLWRDNIDVKSNGTTITFTGGIFASNANVQDFYSTTQTSLEKLRFKKANFKFTKYDDEYVYYTVNSPKDTD